MKNVFLSIALTTAAAFSFAAEFDTIPVKLPRKYLAGYSGFELGGQSLEQFIANYLDPMAKAGFNCVDLKIFQVKPGNRLDLSNPDIFKDLAALIKAANDRNMLFSTYVFTEPYQGKRNVKEYPQHAKLSAFVDEDGRTVENLFCITDYAVMRELYNNAYELAKASTKLPIAAVKFDIENIFNYGISYDDKNWAAFCAENPAFNAAVPASQRVAALKAGNAETKYKEFFILQFEKTVKRIADELHEINPRLSLV